MRRRLAPVLALAVLSCAAAPAAAQTPVPTPPPVPAPAPVPALGDLTYAEPAANVAVKRGGLPWFAVTAPGAVSVRFLIGVEGEADEDGLLRAPIAGDEVLAAEADGAFGWRLAADALPAIRPGVYWWQAVAVGADGTRKPGPLRPYRVTLPAAGLVKGRIPAKYGKQGRGGFALTTRGKPSEVSKSRFWSVAAVSARRWGLRAEGWTTRRTVTGDGYSVMGFGRLPMSVMGLTRARIRTDTGAIVEADVILNDRLKWEDGPDYPWFDEADLESVVLHELGHFAGNTGHVGGCTSSPLNEYGSLGEWWRAPGDRFRLDCTRVTQPAATGSASGWRLSSPPRARRALPPAIELVSTRTFLRAPRSAR